MNKRIQNLISLLLKEPNIKISEMMQKLSLSRRQINYAIELINDQLRSMHIPEIIRYRNGSFGYDHSIELLLQSNGKEYPEEYSDNDRITLILAYLTLNTNYVSLNHLTSFLGYSKTTVANDVKKAQILSKKSNVELKYNRTEGYFLNGSKDDIYRLATLLFSNNAKLFTDDIILEITQNKTIAKKATVLIMDIEDKFKVIFSDTYFMALKFIIQVILLRSQKSKKQVSNHDDSFISQTNEYKFLKNYPALKNLDNYDLKWISLEILTSNVYDKSNLLFGTDEKKIFRFTHQIVEGFKQKTLVQIDNQTIFEKRLMNHLRPACYRVKYHLPNIGMMDVETDQNNQILLKIVKELVEPLEKWIGTSFPINEIQILTYYFGYQLVNESSSISKKKTKYKAVVVCSNGIIMSNILIRVLEKLFPEIIFLFSMSMREFENSEISYDVVFSTIPLKTNKLEYIVKPDMNYSEKIALRYRVLKQLGIEKNDDQVNELLKLISKYAKINNSQKLKNEIEKVLLINNWNVTNYRGFPNLLYYINPNYIVINQEKNIDWKKALHLALAPLLKDKKIELRYEKELQRQINSPNNYSFLGTNISIPHSLPKTGILGNGISLFISKWPIKLPYNRRVFVIAPVALYSHPNYSRAVKQFARLAMNQKIISQITNCQTSLDVYQMISKFIEIEDKHEN